MDEESVVGDVSLDERDKPTVSDSIETVDRLGVRAHQENNTQPKSRPISACSTDEFELDVVL